MSVFKVECKAWPKPRRIRGESHIDVLVELNVAPDDIDYREMQRDGRVRYVIQGIGAPVYIKREEKR